MQMIPRSSANGAQVFFEAAIGAGGSRVRRAITIDRDRLANAFETHAKDKDARNASVRNDAKTNAAIAAAGQGARSPLRGSRGEISPLRGATKRSTCAPGKGRAAAA